MDLNWILSEPIVVWFLIGLIFLVLEFIFPGLIVMFLGFGAWVTAICCLLFDISLNGQLIIFILTSAISLLFLRKYFKKIFVGKAVSNDDDLMEEFIGKTAIVDSEILKGRQGKVRFRGTTWNANSDEEIAKDVLVEIIDKESIVLKVKKKE